MTENPDNPPVFKQLRDLRELVNPAGPRKRLAVAVAQDEFSLDAIYKAFRSGVVDPVLIGDEDQILQLARDKNYNFTGLRWWMCRTLKKRLSWLSGWCTMGVPIF